MKVSELLELLPHELTDQLAASTGVDHSVQRLRGRVFLELLLFGLLNSECLSHRVLQSYYNSEVFEAFSSKDAGHFIQHSSIAVRLRVISVDYFKAIFEWAYTHFFDQFGGSKWEQKVTRFDSTMIRISSTLVDWGMRVGRPPKEQPQQVQLKVTLGLKGTFPKTVQLYTEQQHLSEETALYQAIRQSNHRADDMICFDRGLNLGLLFKNLTNRTLCSSQEERKTCATSCSAHTLRSSKQTRTRKCYRTTSYTCMPMGTESSNTNFDSCKFRTCPPKNASTSSPTAPTKRP